MKKMIFSGLAVLSLFLGCASATYYGRVKVEVIGATAAKKPYGTVECFQSKEKVTASYDVIANMSIEGETGDETGVIKAFQDRAAEIGADAVILDRGNDAAGKNAINRAEAIHFK